MLNVYQKTGDAEDLLAMAAVKVVSIGWLLRYVAIAVLRVYRAVSVCFMFTHILIEFLVKQLL